MADETELTIGAQARCSDGPGGEVIRIVIDPATRTVTHLAIELKHHWALARLVPLDLVDTTTGGEIRLRCTLAEFDHLDAAEEIQMVEDIAPADLGPSDLASPLAEAAPTEVEDVVPLGETELRRGEHVHAVDGEIGQVQGVIIDRDDHRVTHVLLREGHLWGRKEVAIPVSAVTDVTDGIVLNLTKEQVEDLPPLGR
jgi:sporulation protein YlmC with PRC-barrel domain